MEAVLCAREEEQIYCDGLPTKDRATVTTGPGSAAPTFTQCDLTPCFTQPLMQTQLRQSVSIQAPPREHSEGFPSQVTTKIYYTAI